MTVIKHPANQIGENHQHCGACGKRLFGTWQTAPNGWGPCECSADSPENCQTLRHYSQSARDMTRVEHGLVKPEAKAQRQIEADAILSAAGVTGSTRARWDAEAADRTLAKAELAKVRYQDDSWFAGLRGFLRGDAAARPDVRLLALLGDLGPELSPDISKETTWSDICAWHDRLAREASELLSDPGEYEMGDAT